MELIIHHNALLLLLQKKLSCTDAGWLIGVIRGY